MAHNENHQVQLQFLGAAGTVTGSKTYLQTNKYKILIDCGLFQGGKSERKLNKLDKLPFAPSELDAILVTHGHLDHTGYLPVLVKKGFKGPIYATHPTKEIAEVILHDSAKIQAEDTAAANKRRDQSRKPRKPLYKTKHVNKTISLFETHPDKEWVELGNRVKFRFLKSGHILGSASIELEVNGKIFLFSGDVGQRAPLILDAPVRSKKADYVILESTYGDKLHDLALSPYQALQEVVNSTFDKGGTLVIPSFAVERAQEIIVLLHNLMEEKSIPSVPVYLDSPMGIDITRLFQDHSSWHNLTESETEKLTKNVHIIQEYQETLGVLHADGPKQKIIIAGSGMVTGGRVLYYLKQLVGDAKNTVLLVGHQATGTRGQQLASGAPFIKIDGEKYKVEAQVSQIGSLSAHGDQEDLLWWLGLLRASKQVFLNHGEPEAAEALRTKIKGQFKWPVEIAAMDKTYTL
ncbi:MBL fold metallo-hydrolase RNA specificity domain-containing protein [Pontibacter akesuensis]|uniref:Metallo-beta-lactamase family protein n=1 Tax=Pontibacter akesuensis TaxID=388950 RepID=A0A1I7G0Q3_9BACT|nr:MBL fold metallo-hydrolase [Pontibacter akesuensis]GHA59474.1 MBL fold hydrolase [Pontibacter akesuensis]SFU42038.1 metallo-beta-lactamase family protein [Pontibacter akesuensis]